MSALLALAAVTALAAVAGALLARLDAPGPDDDARAALLRRVEALLPQTQCAQCDHPGCRPYAEAIVDGRAPIDRCPPGGERTVRALAELLGQDVPAGGGAVTSAAKATPPPVAYVDESACIGCALCIKACPVDAIVGAARFTHTVIADDCTGCELCLPPCPVDCIALLPRERTLAYWRWPAPAAADDGAMPGATTSTEAASGAAAIAGTAERRP